MRRKTTAFSAILIIFCIFMSTLPASVAADDRTVISIVRGSASTATYPPVFGKTADKPYIMVFPNQGLPAGFNTLGGNWYRKNADSTETKLEDSDTFTEGTYYFRCKVQISAPDGTKYVLNKDGITAEVNGVKWETDGDVFITEKSSYVWVKSPERVVKSPYKNMKMSFEPNGGTGTQAPVYTDQYGYISLPECEFTKKGDKFFAWNIGDVLHFPDESYRITKDTAAAAVWESELTRNIAVTMSAISEGTTPSGVVFDSGKSKCTVSAVWYKGDSVDKFNIVDNGAPLSVGKNYTVRLTINSTEFLAPADKLNITLNGKKINNILQRASKKVILDVQILNDVSVEFWEPMDGVPLATSSEITPNSDKFSVISAMWYGRINALPGEQYQDGTAAIPGKKYYLSLTLQSTTENLILGGDTVKVNGIPYRAEERDIPSNKDSVIVILEFTTTSYPRVRISEDSEGRIIVESPKALEATFAAALYDSSGRMTDITITPNFALVKGINKIFPTDIVEGEKIKKFLYRTNGEKVKIVVLQNMSSLSPICPALNYKTNLI